MRCPPAGSRALLWTELVALVVRRASQDAVRCPDERRPARSREVPAAPGAPGAAVAERRARRGGSGHGGPRRPGPRRTGPDPPPGPRGHEARFLGLTPPPRAIHAASPPWSPDERSDSRCGSGTVAQAQAQSSAAGDFVTPHRQRSGASRVARTEDGACGDPTPGTRGRRGSRSSSAATSSGSYRLR